MNRQAWHVLDDQLARYVDGGAGATERHSIETHLWACDTCRRAVAARRGPDPAADRNWDGVLDRIDRHRSWLRRPSATAHAVAGSPALLLATLSLSGGLLLVTVLLRAFAPSATLPVLVALAPLLAPAGAVAAFRPGIDPAGALAEATPFAAGRLPYVRAAYAAAVVAIAGLAAAAVTPLGWSSLAVWLGPALALATVVAAVATWIDPVHVAGSATAMWWTVVAVWTERHRGPWTAGALHDLAASRPGVQLACVVVTIAATAVCVVRRDARPAWRTA